jgi:hypothetical protein
MTQRYIPEQSNLQNLKISQPGATQARIYVKNEPQLNEVRKERNKEITGTTSDCSDTDGQT